MRELTPYEISERKRLKISLAEDIYNVDGVLYWKSSNNIVPTHVFEDAGMVPTDIQIAAYNKDTTEFLDRYREKMKDYEPSDVEKNEMRAAFGEGTKVINIVTGKEFTV